MGEPGTAVWDSERQRAAERRAHPPQFLLSDTKPVFKMTTEPPQMAEGSQLKNHIMVRE